MSSSNGIKWENEIRELLEKIGFEDVPGWGDNRETVSYGGQEIDAFGRIGSVYVVVDAKMSTSPSATAEGSQSQLTLISGYRQRVIDDIQERYSRHGFVGCAFIYWTKGKTLPQDRIVFARDNNIALRDEFDLKYYNDALELLENSEIVRNSFLKDISLQIEGEFFETRPNFEIPTIMTRIGDKILYTFQLHADTLLKLCYVFRLETNNLNILYSYQRLLKGEKISKIVMEEKKRGNLVYINMSGAGRLTSVASTLVGMVHNVKVYYVESTGYADKDPRMTTHGYSIVEGTPHITMLANFQINMPNEIQQKTLVNIYENEGIKTIDLIEYLGSEGFQDYAVDYYRLSRNEKTALIMKLNRNIIDKLAESGYITKTKLGRENTYKITDTGKYIASISGLL